MQGTNQKRDHQARPDDALHAGAYVTWSKCLPESPRFAFGRIRLPRQIASSHAGHSGRYNR